MVLYGVAAGVSISDMLLAGLLPGLLMSFLLISLVVFICVRRNYRCIGEFCVKALGKSLWEAALALFTPIIILGGIYSGIFTPTEAAAISCFYALLIGLFAYRELTFKTMLPVLYKSFKLAASIMLIVGATQAFGWVLTREGIPQAIAAWVTSVIADPTLFLFAVAFLLLGVGCILDAVPALLLLSPILCPTAASYGIDLVHFGVVVVFTLCIGLVTPPVGINLFVVSAVGQRPMHTIIKHLPPFLAIACVGAILVILFPSISLFLLNK